MPGSGITASRVCPGYTFVWRPLGAAFASTRAAGYTRGFEMKEPFRESMARLEEEHWWFRARRTILDRAVDRFVGRTGLALTVGVGATREAEMLARRSRLVAIDRAPIDENCTSFALATRADALALPFADEVFDAVFIFDVLEHIDDDARVLAEIRRVLRPGAKLLITVPAFMFLFGLQDVVSEHKRRYRRRGLADLLRRSGFEVDYNTYFNTLLFPPIAAVRLLRRVFPKSDADAEAGSSDFDLRLPGPVEKILESVFSAERRAIGAASLPFGISILCAARRSSSPR
jgi:SAM-dependent methyltransferase